MVVSCSASKGALKCIIKKISIRVYVKNNERGSKLEHQMGLLTVNIFMLLKREKAGRGSTVC